MLQEQCGCQARQGLYGGRSLARRRNRSRFKSEAPRFAARFDFEKKKSNDQIKIEIKIKKAEALPAKAETAETFPRSIPQAQHQ